MSRLVLVAVITAALAARPAAAAEGDELAKFLPDPFNAVAVINVSTILKSERAQKEGWAKADHTEFLAGAVPVHPSIERILLATEIIPQRPGAGRTLAVIPLKNPIDLEKLAKMRGGDVTTVAGEKCIVCPNEENYLIPLSDTVVGAIKTDHRPEVGKWMKEAKDSKKSPLSTYLNSALYTTGRTHNIFVGLDTEDLLGPKKAKALVDISTAVKGTPEAPAVEAFVAGLRGLRFTANIRTDGIDARILIDSRVEPKFRPETMKDFLLEILDRNGAGLEDLLGATAKIDGKSVVLAFKINDSELAKVMSIFSVPAHNIGDEIPLVGNQVNPDATRRYFKAVNQITDDLRKKAIKLDELEKSALWHDTAANKIESMSVLGVDPAVIDFGRGTAGRLRVMAHSLAGLPVKGQELDEQTYAMVSPHQFGWGSFGGQFVTQSNYPEIMQKKQKLIKEDAAARTKIWKQVDDERTRVRDVMKSKYSGDFGK